MDVTKPCQFIRFGAMEVPYQFVRFGAMDVTKPYQFIWFGAMEITKPFQFIRFGAPEILVNGRGRSPIFLNAFPGPRGPDPEN